MTQCSSIIAGSTMLAALPFLLCYSGLTVALCHQDLRHGLLPDRYTCPLLWSGLLFYLCLAPHQLHDAVWGAIAGYLSLAAIYWLYRGIRGYEGLGYGDIKYLAALGAGMAGGYCRSWSWLLATRRHSVGRSRFIRQLRREEQMEKKQPAAVWAIPGGRGFLVRVADAG